ncbi:hypothetical protein ACH50O_11560 [Methylomonas sp. 2BW1-5-20]|uniref:hypothetical protein n=1 Tax=Methylomonas sp. 2BW1-5-20 TaxID=3376686 RepID=UPI00405077D5
MTRERKATLHGNAKAANIKQQQGHFTQSTKRVKQEFIRLAVWWRIAWGTLI